MTAGALVIAFTASFLWLGFSMGRLLSLGIVSSVGLALAAHVSVGVIGWLAAILTAPEDDKLAELALWVPVWILGFLVDTGLMSSCPS